MWQPPKSIFTLPLNASLADIAFSIYLKEGKSLLNFVNKDIGNSSARLYYIKFTNKKLNYNLYKLGFTQRTVKERVAELNNPDFNISIIQIVLINKPKYAYGIEQYLHNKYKKYRYAGPPLFNYGNGNSEVYNKDIFGFTNTETIRKNIKII